MFRVLSLVFTVGLSAACVDSGHDVELQAARFEAGDLLFQSSTNWLGGDAAYSILIDDHRTLWLFGDSLVSADGTSVRRASTMVHNTVAVQTGSDVVSASIEFYWGAGPDGGVSSFFADRESSWYWPGHGVRLSEGPIVVFLKEVARDPNDGLGFKVVGAAVVAIENPDAPVDDWLTHVASIPKTSFDALPATAVVRDGDFVVALATRERGTHAGYLVRYRSRDLARGLLGSAEWWSHDLGWVSSDESEGFEPSVVMADAGAEASVHWEPRLDRFVHVASYGFGDTWIGLRTSPRLVGPWSEPSMVMRPPESGRPGVLVYAAKAHPQLVVGSGDLLVTYATNSFDFEELLAGSGEGSLYWPRFVAVTFPD